MNEKSKCSNCKRFVPADSKFCPFCGTSLAAVNDSSQNNTVSSRYDIVLGETTIAEVADTHGLWNCVRKSGEKGWGLEVTPGFIVSSVHSPHNPIIMVLEYWNAEDVHSQFWHTILPLSPYNTNEFISWCRNNRLNYVQNNGGIVALLHSETLVRISPDNAIGALKLPPCPNCGEFGIHLGKCLAVDNKILCRCLNCRYEFDVIDVLMSSY